MSKYEVPLFSRPAIRRFIVATSATPRVSELTYEEVRAVIDREAYRLLETASNYSRISKRKRITVRDLQVAIKTLDGVSYAGAKNMKKVVVKRSVPKKPSAAKKPAGAKKPAAPKTAAAKRAAAKRAAARRKALLTA